ncbi:MAG: hypothetical protein ABR956_02640 [Terracidiphilus sp.]
MFTTPTVGINPPAPSEVAPDSGQFTTFDHYLAADAVTDGARALHLIF